MAGEAARESLVGGAAYPVLLDEAGHATQHPLIDCGGLVHAIRSARGTGEGEGRAEAAARIGRKMVSALIARGYFFADADSVLPLALMKQTYAQMSLAHDEIPDEVKAAMTGLERSRLYWSPQGNEDEYEPGTKATAQHWSFSRTGQAGQLDPPEVASLVGFDAFADRLYAAQDLLADAVMAGVAAGLGLPLDEFSRHLRGGDLGTIRFIRYPPSDPQPDRDARGISAHTDFEFFTLMHQDQPGLQFKLPPGKGHEAGQWIDAPVRSESYVIIVGDMLERFTNGLLKATPHRVVACPWQRHSIIRFVAVHPETLVEPMPQFITAARPRAYTPVTMKEHMATTLGNLAEGKGAWDIETESSITATYEYGDHDEAQKAGEQMPDARL